MKIISPAFLGVFLKGRLPLLRVGGHAHPSFAVENAIDIRLSALGCGIDTAKIHATPDGPLCSS